MENNRYREEEKELEESASKVEKKETIENQENLAENLEEKLNKTEEELKNDEKLNKKLKKKVKHLEEEISKLTDELNQTKDQLLRNRADLENFKRRTSEERIKERKYAMQDFFSEIIDVIDVFDKAVNIKTEDEKLKKYLSGFVMVNTRLKQTLENYGVKKIECLNKEFNPSCQQALETVEKEGVESNIVIEVVMDGYMYKDRVLRPSMVKVSK